MAAFNFQTLSQSQDFKKIIKDGLELFEKIGDNNPDQESSGTCKNLEELDIY